MMSAVEEEQYYLGVYDRVEVNKQQDPSCDEITVLALELNNLFYNLRKVPENSPEAEEFWGKIVISTNFLLAMRHDPKNICY